MDLAIFQTSCHEDTTDINASMVTGDLSSNQHTDSGMDTQDAIGASQHSPCLNHAHKPNKMNFKYVSVGRHHHHHKKPFTTVGNDYNGDVSQKLSNDPEMDEKLDSVWEEVERVMGSRYSETCKVLEVYGIGEGEEDSETEEGQLWRMIQGDAPYTLNLV